MAKVKLKNEISGNRRNVICGGRRVTVYKNAYQTIPDNWVGFFNAKDYDIITDGVPIVKTEVKEEVKEEIKETPKKKFTLKTK